MSKLSDFSMRVSDYLSSIGLSTKDSTNLKHELNLFQRSAPVIEPNEAFDGVTRNEIVVKLISTLLGLSVSFVVTYFGVKWLVNALDPTQQEKKEAHLRAQNLMKRIGVTAATKLTDYELCIAANLVDPLAMDITWDNIGGLKDTIQEIKETVILPFKRHDLFNSSSLIQAPKGVLLYGPPGCGKTLLAKAMAKAAGARFINLQISSLVDKWYGESQKRAEAVFSLALKLQPTIIFIDEIDSFLRSRTSSDHEATNMIKTQFMSFWDGLATDARSRIMIVGATNRPNDVDAAILRRMPSMYKVDLPNVDQRFQILQIILRDETLHQDVNLREVAQETIGFTGSDLKELCRMAAIYRVREVLHMECLDSDEFHDALSSALVLRGIEQKDFTAAIKRASASRKMATFAQMTQLDVD